MKVKFRTWLLSFLIIGISVAFSASCKKNPLNTCVDTAGCNGKVYKTCANPGGGGYYEYNGVRYSWTGTNATAAATQLVTAMGCK